MKFCGTLLSAGARGKVVGTATQGIRIHLLPTPQLCSSAPSSQQWEERPGRLHGQDPYRWGGDRALRAASGGGGRVLQLSSWQQRE